MGIWTSNLCQMKIPNQKRLHSWLPNGLTLLAGAPKVGKSTLAEQIAFEVSKQGTVIYLALEYNLPMAKARFARFHDSPVLILLDGDLNRFGKGGEKQLKELLRIEPCELLIIDVLTCLKRPTAGDYTQEYAAVQEIKNAVSSFEIDCLALHHTRKGDSSENHNVFEAIHGSTALTAVPENIMILTKKNNQVKLQMKGRLIPEDEIDLEFLNGEFFKSNKITTGHEVSAPFLHQILATLKDGDATSQDLSKKTGKSMSQISTACKKLLNKGEIINPTKGLWQLAI